MSTKILDRSRPFGVVVGASTGAVHHQDGVCFGGADREIGAPPAQVAPTPPAETTTTPEPTPEPTPTPDGAVTREELLALHPSQIKKLVESNGLVLETGAGSKKRNIENLLTAG